MMQTLPVTAALFAAGFLIHVVWWRVRLPVAQRKALVQLFFGLLLVALPVLISMGMSPFTVLRVASMYVPLVLAYVCFYTTIECDSPTLTLMQAVYRGGPGGVALAELNALWQQRPFLASRLNILSESGQLVERDGRLFLNGPVPPLIRIVLLVNRLYGKKGGG